MPQINEIEEKDLEDYEEVTRLDPLIRMDRTKSSTSYFMTNYLNKPPREWQHVFLKKIDKGAKRIICVTSRQIGKTTAVGAFGLKASLFNLFPSGIDKKTHIGIISATEEQAIRLLDEIKKMIDMADTHIEQITKDEENPERYVKYFSKMIDQKETNNKTTITFTNGCDIKSLPPTTKIKGFYFSYVFVDEGAFIEDNDLFFNYIEPTVSATNGAIVITTTPNGLQGWIYDLFDPEDKREQNEWTRLWFNYKIIKDKVYQDRMEQKKNEWMEIGKEKNWYQEYEALFTSQVSAFIPADRIDAIINPELVRYDTYLSKPVDVGIDFGVVTSRTVVTMFAVDGKKSKMIYDYEYKTDEDKNLVQDMIYLSTKFRINRVIVDDCPAAHFIMPKLKEAGFNVVPMSFKAEKIAKYLALRTKIFLKLIEFYPCTENTSQWKALQIIEGVASTKIEKGSGSRDDYPDSVLMANYFFLSEDGEFDSFISAPVEKKVKDIKEARIDKQWDTLIQYSSNPEMREELEMWGGIK